MHLQSAAVTRLWNVSSRFQTLLLFRLTPRTNKEWPTFSCHHSQHHLLGIPSIEKLFCNLHLVSRTPPLWNNYNHGAPQKRGHDRGLPTIKEDSPGSFPRRSGIMDPSPTTTSCSTTDHQRQASRAPAPRTHRLSSHSALAAYSPAPRARGQQFSSQQRRPLPPTVLPCRIFSRGDQTKTRLDCQLAHVSEPPYRPVPLPTVPRT